MRDRLMILGKTAPVPLRNAVRGVKSGQRQWVPVRLKCLFVPARYSPRTDGFPARIGDARPSRAEARAYRDHDNQRELSRGHPWLWRSMDAIPERG